MEALPPDLVEALERSGYSKEGFAAHYDAYRPSPPPILLDLLPLVAQVERPALVVDLGSGTGLSTRFWAERADAVVGVEPNPEMRAQAERATSAANVRYVGASAYATGLPEACADIVTCSQSLQWMDPETTFAEVDRILRPGGVFAAYEYRSLVTRSCEAVAAWLEVGKTVRRLRQELGLDEGKQRWPPSLERLEVSRRFRFATETRVHSVESGNADPADRLCPQRRQRLDPPRAGLGEGDRSRPAARARGEHARRRARALACRLPGLARRQVTPAPRCSFGRC